MLCSMLSSEDKDIREQGLKLVKEAKKNPHVPRQKILRGIRKLQIPEIQWDGSGWHELIDFNKVTISVPRDTFKLFSTSKFEEHYIHEHFIS